MKESVQNLPFHGDAKPEAILISEIFDIIPYIYIFFGKQFEKEIFFM